MTASPVTPRADGVELAVKVTPAGSRCAQLAQSLGVAPSAVEPVAGERTRWKPLRVAAQPGTDRPAPR